LLHSQSTRRRQSTLFEEALARKTFSKWKNKRRHYQWARQIPAVVATLVGGLTKT
jgi:hypothetical protein